MNKTNNKIPPTITLAQLYEAQQQYFDAYLIYKKIYETNEDESILERIEKSKSKIFIDPNMHYHSLIDNLFSTDEKAAFKILPNENYLNYQKSLINEIEETEFIEDDFDEDEEDMTDAEEIEEIYNPVDLPPFEEFTSGISDMDSLLQNHFSETEMPEKVTPVNILSISDFCLYLTKTFGSDKKITDLSLGDVFMILEKIKH